MLLTSASSATFASLASGTHGLERVCDFIDLLGLLGSDGKALFLLAISGKEQGLEQMMVAAVDHGYANICPAKVTRDLQAAKSSTDGDDMGKVLHGCSDAGSL